MVLFDTVGSRSSGHSILCFQSDSSEWKKVHIGYFEDEWVKTKTDSLSPSEWYPLASPLGRISLM
jgi:hypothetical protein